MRCRRSGGFGSWKLGGQLVLPFSNGCSIPLRRAFAEQGRATSPRNEVNISSFAPKRRVRERNRVIHAASRLNESASPAHGTECSDLLINPKKYGGAQRPDDKESDREQR